MENIAIVTVAYNRVKSLSRLLNSLLCADIDNAPLIISIDKSNTNEVERYANDFIWPYIIRKSKFPQNPKRSVRFSGKGTKRSVQKRKARNTQKAETKVL